MPDEEISNSFYSGRDNYNVFNRVLKRTEIVRGYGTIASTGIPSNPNAPITTEQVDFKLNIYRVQGKYEGEVNIVNYDTRSRYTSNNLLFFTGNEISCLCVFSVLSDDGCCSYNLTVEASPSNRGITPALYAHAAPISVAGVNVGGFLVCGEILFCTEPSCYSR